MFSDFKNTRSLDFLIRRIYTCVYVVASDSMFIQTSHELLMNERTSWFGGYSYKSLLLVEDIYIEVLGGIGALRNKLSMNCLFMHL
jgi:hypothetical protein